MVATLPSLAYLGVPTEGNGKKARKAKEKTDQAQAELSAEGAATMQDVDLWDEHLGGNLREQLRIQRAELGVEVLSDPNDILKFLAHTVRYIYQNDYMRRVPGLGPAEFPSLWKLHGRLCQAEAAKHILPGNPPSDALHMSSVMGRTYYTIAEYVYAHFLIHYWPFNFRGVPLRRERAGPGSDLRTTKEVERIINEPDTMLLLVACSTAFQVFFPPADEPVLEKIIRDYFQRITKWSARCHALREERARLDLALTREPRGLRGPRAPEAAKSRTEFEDLKKRSAKREKEEAEARIAKAAEDAAKIQRWRTESQQQLERNVQEEADRFNQLSVRNVRNSAGSSRDHEAAPLSPKSAHKAALLAKEVQDAKEASIADKRVRIMAQVEAYRKAQAEEAARLAERARALQLADAIQRGV